MDFAEQLNLAKAVKQRHEEEIAAYATAHGQPAADFLRCMLEAHVYCGLISSHIEPSISGLAAKEALTNLLSELTLAYSLHLGIPADETLVHLDVANRMYRELIELADAPATTDSMSPAQVH